MKEYIEKILHRDVLIEPYRDVERLPLSYRSGYELSRMTRWKSTPVFPACYTCGI